MLGPNRTADFCLANRNITDATMRWQGRSTMWDSPWPQQQQQKRLSELAVWSMLCFLSIFFSLSYSGFDLCMSQEVAWKHPFSLMHGNFVIIGYINRLPLLSWHLAWFMVYGLNKGHLPNQWNNEEQNALFYLFVKWDKSIICPSLSAPEQHFTGWLVYSFLQ